MSDPQCNFYIGQKITLVEDIAAHPEWAAYAKTHGIVWPEFGVVYHVRELFEDTGLRRIGVRLKEIVNPVFHFADGIKELGFHHVLFRPVTDISDFERLLKEANSGEGNPARRRSKVEAL